MLANISIGVNSEINSFVEVSEFNEFKEILSFDKELINTALNSK